VVFDRTDLHFGWQRNDRRWGLALYVNNLFNQRYVVDGNPVSAVLGTPYAYVTAPRLMGLQLNVRM